MITDGKHFYNNIGNGTGFSNYCNSLTTYGINVSPAESEVKKSSFGAMPLFFSSKSVVVLPQTIILIVD